MYHYSQPTQIFTVFGDYVRTSNARGSEARYVARKAEAASASREAARL